MKRTLLSALLWGGLSLAAGSAQATVLNLTEANSSGTILSATYTQVPTQPTGSGYIDPFVRIGAAGMNVVQGYNTTANNIYQNGMDDTFNHEVTVGDIGLIDTNGSADGGLVMRFLLDINQTGANPLLSLNEFQLYISSTANQSLNPTLALYQTIPLGTLVYQMDGGGVDSRVELDYSNNSGSGSGDMIVDIPFELLNAAFFAGGFDTALEQNAAFIYLYSRFGETDGMENNDGFEEWTALAGQGLPPPCPPGEDCGPQGVPEPGSLSLLALGLIGAAVASKRRRRR